MSKPKKRWAARVTRKQDVIVVKIALLLRQLDYSWTQKAALRKATAFIGAWDIVEKLS